MEKQIIEQVYETMSSIPGMNDMVKIRIEMSRRNVLILSLLIDAGLPDPNYPAVVKHLNKERLSELKALPADLLNTASLTQLAEKLSTFLSD